MVQHHLALIWAPFAALVLFVIVMVGTSVFGCNPYHREIGVTSDGIWRDLPDHWSGKVPAVERLHPAYLANRARARALGVCQ